MDRSYHCTNTIRTTSAGTLQPRADCPPALHKYTPTHKYRDTVTKAIHVGRSAGSRQRGVPTVNGALSRPDGMAAVDRPTARHTAAGRPGGVRGVRMTAPDTRRSGGGSRAPRAPTVRVSRAARRRQAGGGGGDRPADSAGGGGGGGGS